MRLVWSLSHYYHNDSRNCMTCEGRDIPLENRWDRCPGQRWRPKQAWLKNIIFDSDDLPLVRRGQAGSIANYVSYLLRQMNDMKFLETVSEGLEDPFTQISHHETEFLGITDRLTIIALREKVAELEEKLHEGC